MDVDNAQCQEESSHVHDEEVAAKAQLFKSFIFRLVNRKGEDYGVPGILRNDVKRGDVDHLLEYSYGVSREVEGHEGSVDYKLERVDHAPDFVHGGFRYEVEDHFTDHCSLRS